MYGYFYENQKINLLMELAIDGRLDIYIEMSWIK